MMGQITVVGLGPGAPELLTREAWAVLSAATEVWLRTARHPTVSGLPASLAVHSFDAVYEQQETFAQVYEAVVAQVLALGRRAEGVVYAVPGHPLVGEATVLRLLALARAEALPVRIVAGLSFVEPALTALELDALEGLQIADALELVALHHPSLNPDRPALIAQVYNRAVASDLKLTLMNQLPDEYQVALVEAAGTTGQVVEWLPLYAIDRRELGPLTSLYVPPAPQVSSFEGFQETIARLRAPGGCPWDREQTHASLRNNLLEEAYEVLDAIDRDDLAGLCEELGDLLLQIVLHTQIATEEGDFQMPAVIAGIDAKIKRRHPHVWGDRQVSGAAEVIRNWEVLKRQERASNGQGERSLLDSVPRSLPALAQAHAYGSRAARVKFDWPELAGVVAKVREELAELEAAATPEAQAAELGDLLFAVANWARWLKVDPESALRETNGRFARRFRHLEAAARQRGIPLEQLSAEEMDRLWEEAKALEAASLEDSTKSS